MKWQYIEEQLEKHNLIVFTSQEFRRAANLSVASAKQLLVRHVKKGLVIRLKENRGLYCLKRKPPHKWFLANKLLRPSYVSLESALSHYGAIPEAVYGVTSVTPLITRSFEALDTAFTFQKIKESAYTGYRPIEVSGATALVAEPEKALADYLYFVHLGKKKLNDRIRWAIFNKTRVNHYLNLFKRRGFEDWATHVVSNHH